MVQNSVWREEAGFSKGHCHLKCLEIKIGRRLRIEDFTRFPINDAIRFGYQMSGKEGFVDTKVALENLNFGFIFPDTPMYNPDMTQFYVCLERGYKNRTDNLLHFFSKGLTPLERTLLASSWTVIDSVRKLGMINPLIVGEIREGYYPVVVGNQRLLALRVCAYRGWRDPREEIPIIIDPSMKADRVFEVFPPKKIPQLEW